MHAWICRDFYLCCFVVLIVVVVVVVVVVNTFVSFAP